MSNNDEITNRYRELLNTCASLHRQLDPTSFHWYVSHDMKLHVCHNSKKMSVLTKSSTKPKDAQSTAIQSQVIHWINRIWDFGKPFPRLFPVELMFRALSFPFYSSSTSASNTNDFGQHSLLPRKLTKISLDGRTEVTRVIHVEGLQSQRDWSKQLLQQQQ